jgi:hypothetical protein
MRKRLIPVLSLLALVFALTACGDDGGTVFEESTTTTTGPTTTGGVTTTAGPTTTGGVTTTGGGSSALAGMVFSALAESAGTDTTLGAGGDEECIASGLADAIGAARFAELDAIATSAANMPEVFSQMTDAELSALVDVIVGCVDVETMLTEQITGSDFSPEAAACFAGSLSQGDTMKNLIRAMMTGEDPSTNPEFMQIMIQVMTQDCADPLEAMLVDEFVANGASAETAACIAAEFMQGGLFEAIMNSMLGGTDFTTDPEFAAQMQEIITGCSTP